MSWASDAMGGQADIRAPGRTASNYRSDSMTFKTVKVPEQVRER